MYRYFNNENYQFFKIFIVYFFPQTHCTRSIFDEKLKMYGQCLVYYVTFDFNNSKTHWSIIYPVNIKKQYR